MPFGKKKKNYCWLFITLRSVESNLKDKFSENN